MALTLPLSPFATSTRRRATVRTRASASGPSVGLSGSSYAFNLISEAARPRRLTPPRASASGPSAVGLRSDSSAVESEADEPGSAPVPLSEGPGLLIGVRAFVAGATGETGRLLVEKLAAQGAIVRALVRDTGKAEKVLVRKAGVEAVVGDVYKYETLQAAIGDSNVVFVATGARPSGGLLPDPLGPYKIDYVGTLNVIAAARASGKVIHARSP